MKIAINSGNSAQEVSADIAKAVAAKFTHASDGTNVHALSGLKIGDIVGKDVELTFGVKLPGLPFEERPLAEGETLAPAKTKKVKSAAAKAIKAITGGKNKPAPKTAKPKGPKEPKVREDSGFVKLIDGLLTETDGKGKQEGFARSTSTVDDALKAVLKKFPDKNPVSIKKIIKVRPRHLEKRKDGVFNDTTKRAPRWAIVGPGKNGSMTEIDAMFAKDKSVAEIVEHLHLTHGRDKAKTKEVVTSRIALLKKRAKDEKAAGK